MNSEQKVPYICSSLTDIRLTPVEILEALEQWEYQRELLLDQGANVTEQLTPHDVFVQYAAGQGFLAAIEKRRVDEFKEFLEEIGVVVEFHVCAKPFIPHHHFDPIKNSAATPQEVRDAEGQQIDQRTSVLIVFGDYLSWGGGIEIGWAEDRGIPIILLRTRKRISRLLLGVRTLCADILYENKSDLVPRLKVALRHALNLQEV